MASAKFAATISALSVLLVLEKVALLSPTVTTGKFAVAVNAQTASIAMDSGVIPTPIVVISAVVMESVSMTIA